VRLLLIVIATVSAVAPCAADPAKASRSPEMIYRAYESPKGTVEMLANARKDGSTLHLADIAVYPRGAKKLELGMRDLLLLKNQLLSEARAEGFSKVHITGTRLTGAKPGKHPDLWFEVPPAR